MLEIANAANASGDVRIANQDGSVNVLGGPENTIDVGGSGAIQVSALGTDSSIDIQGIVQSDLGDVELLADGSLTFAATANVNSTDGSVRLLADQDADQQGLIAMQDGAQVDSGLGSIELLAHQTSHSQAFEVRVPVMQSSFVRLLGKSLTTATR